MDWAPKRPVPVFPLPGVVLFPGAEMNLHIYELRYRTVGVTGVDTTSWWNAATSVPSVPAPRIAGTKEAFTVAGLDSGQTYYFIIRTSDEIPNWSAFSDLSVKVARETFTLATPQQFQALATQSSVTLSWSALAPDAGARWKSPSAQRQALWAHVDGGVGGGEAARLETVRTTGERTVAEGEPVLAAMQKVGRGYEAVLEKQRLRGEA